MLCVFFYIKPIYNDHHHKQVQEVDFGSIDGDDSIEAPIETLLPRELVAELCGEAAKLKSLGLLSKVSRSIDHVFFITKLIPLIKLL